MTILFYLPHEEFGWLSNFSRHAIVLQNREWLTVEHYYQAQKFTNPEWIDTIASQSTPHLAKQQARVLGEHIREDWELIKLQIMYDGVFKKFTSYPKLAKKLLETGTDMIAENAPYDYFWGQGINGKGRNELGKILMQIRGSLNESK